jgi:hypothetical protein
MQIEYFDGMDYAVGGQNKGNNMYARPDAAVSRWQAGNSGTTYLPGGIVKGQGIHF